MNGHIRTRGEKGKETYTVIVELERDSEGKRKQKSYGTFKKISEAKKVLTEIQYKINNNDFIVSEDVTVNEFLTFWLDNYAAKLSPTTKWGYSVIINNHLIPELGKIELQKLKPMHIEKYYTKKSESLSGRTLLHHHRVLRKALDYAYKKQYINKNPVDLVDAPKAVKYKAEVLTPLQAKILLREVQGTYLEIPCHIGLALGLRRGEILGLRWSDVDFDNNIIKVEKNLVRVKSELILKEPKSETSKRTLEAPKELIQVLKEHKTKQKEIYLRSKGECKNEENLVCTRNNGKLINPCTFSTVFSKFLKRRNLPDIRFHDLRHTNATFMLLSDTPMKVASGRLGHSTIAITADLYTHVLQELDRDAADKLNDVLYK